MRGKPRRLGPGGIAWRAQHACSSCFPQFLSLVLQLVTVPVAALQQATVLVRNALDNANGGLQVE